MHAQVHIHIVLPHLLTNHTKNTKQSKSKTTNVKLLLLIIINFNFLPTLQLSSYPYPPAIQFNSCQTSNCVLCVALIRIATREMNFVLSLSTFAI